MRIIYINDKILIKDDDTIVIEDNLDVKADDIITTSISIKDVITYTFKLPKNLQKEQLQAEADINFFENAGLNTEKEYMFHFITKELDQEESYVIEAIAIEKDKLNEIFSNIVEKTKYIDYISFTPFVFKQFYPLFNKETKKDAFVYLDKNESFISIFENGEYLYSKTLTSLDTLLKNIDMEYDKFIEVISTKGVNKEKYEMDEFLIASEIEKFFSDYFMAINNRLSYGRTIFYLENIDNIYFYTPFKIEGIDELKSFWDLSGINFELIPNEDNILEKLAIEYNSLHYQDDINFSIFPRPPKFYKTKTFQLSMVILITILGFMGDFGYRYYQNSQIQNEVNKLKKQLNKKKQTLKKLETLNKIALEKFNNYQKQIQQIQTNRKIIDNILDNALYIVNLPKKYKDFINISNILERNHLETFV
jgi:hypothetical protein